jgi:hypothetical protein
MGQHRRARPMVREWHMTDAKTLAVLQRQAERKRRRGYQ